MAPKIDTPALENMLPQGAASRHKKMWEMFNNAEDLLPESPFEGTSDDLRKAIQFLNKSAENLAELIAYRKMYGSD